MTTRIDIDYIDIDGFRTFRRASSLDFTRLDPGLHFLSGVNKRNPRLGSNGAGKSSIWGALCLCLWGKTVGGLTKGDTKPWGSKKGAQILGVGITITRGKKQWQHDIERTSSTLLLDGKKVAQEVIVNLLGMTFDIFTHTILLGQGQPLFFDLEPRRALALFSDILHLDRWDVRSKKAKETVANLEIEKAKLHTEADSLERERDRALDDLEKLQEQSDEWEDSRQKRLKDASKLIDQLQAKLDEAEERRDKADLQLESAGTELKAIRRALPKAIKAVETARGKLDDNLNTCDDLKQALEDGNQELANLGKGTKCPTCGADIKGSKLETHRRALLKKIREGEAARTKLTRHGTERLKELREKEKELERLQTDEASYDTDYDKAEAAYKLAAEQATTHQTDLRALRSQAGERKEERNPYQDQISTLKRRARSLAGDIKKLDEQAKDLETQIAQVGFWVKGFKEVKLLEIDECLRELEIVTNGMLDDMGLVDWEIRYDIEKELKSGATQSGLNIMILSPENDDFVKWQVWSGGESQRLRIAGALALSEVLLNYAGIEPGIEILDEPSHAISPEGIADLCDFLADRADRLDRQIWLTDQHALELPAFASVTKVIRDEDGSRIVQEG